MEQCQILHVIPEGVRGQGIHGQTEVVQQQREGKEHNWVRGWDVRPQPEVKQEAQGSQPGQVWQLQGGLQQCDNSQREGYQDRAVPEVL